VSPVVHLEILGTNVLFRECLAAVLGMEERYEVSVAHGDLATARRQLELEPPDLLLVDLSRSRDAMLGAVRELTTNTPIPVLLVGADSSEDDALQCMESGARGYVPIASSLGDLRRSIATVLAGEVAFSPEITPLMFSRLAELSTEHRRSARWDGLALTARELEILTLIAQGLRNKDLAERLSLSLHTIKNHVHHVLKKLKAPNRAEAVRIAMRHGWLKRRG
jgi:DNA-binding NarL/FixJ family response regulator